MEPLTTQQIRSSFINCSKGEANRAPLPALGDVPWASLDFVGWVDPSGSQRAYLVAPDPVTGEPVGLVSRQTPFGAKGSRRATMCQVCLTPHTGSGVALTVAPKAGPGGRKGDTTGIYICRDLGCSLYVRGLRSSGQPQLRETLSEELLIERLQRNLFDFITRVRG